jgi:phospholipid/cholesterol/gamma-HCH transport system permease protein
MTLIGILIGIILAFGGALQLRQLGVQIFVADVVGVAVAQEVGALMTAILLAGRTGAAFAAQLGSMQVKEEIDALTTAGISPVQFLVLPRVLALVLMTPVLTIYADLFAGGRRPRRHHHPRLGHRACGPAGPGPDQRLGMGLVRPRCSAC